MNCRQTNFQILPLRFRWFFLRRRLLAGQAMFTSAEFACKQAPTKEGERWPQRGGLKMWDSSVLCPAFKALAQWLFLLAAADASPGQELCRIVLVQEGQALDAYIYSQANEHKQPPSRKTKEAAPEFGCGLFSLDLSFCL